MKSVDNNREDEKLQFEQHDYKIHLNYKKLNCISSEDKMNEENILDILELLLKLNIWRLHRQIH